MSYEGIVGECYKGVVGERYEGVVGVCVINYSISHITTFNHTYLHHQGASLALSTE